LADTGVHRQTAPLTQEVQLDLGGGPPMVTIILTWIGAVLGIAVLLAMAVGAFAVDVDDALARRREKALEGAAGPSTQLSSSSARQ
jgi:hypothetical protein